MFKYPRLCRRFKALLTLGFVRIMQRLIKTSCAIATKELGKEKTETIAEAAQTRYEELLIENASDSKALRRHTFRRI